MWNRYPLTPRQFLSLMEKPDVDLIEDSPRPSVSSKKRRPITLDQRSVPSLEIYDYLRLLYARVGEPRCPDHGVTLAASTVSEMVDRAPWSCQKVRGFYCWRRSYKTVRRIPATAQKPPETGVHSGLELMAIFMIWIRPYYRQKAQTHTIEVVVDRIVVKARSRATPSGVFRDSACDRGRVGVGPGASRRRWRTRQRNTLLRTLRLPALRIQPKRTRASAFFLQQPSRSLP